MNFRKPFSILVWALLGTGIFLQSCSSSTKTKQPVVKLSFQSFPFYKDYIALDTQNIPAGLQALQQKYPDFLNFYLDTVMRLNLRGNYDQSNQVLSSLLTFKDYRNLFDTVLKRFPNTQQSDQAIKLAYEYLKQTDSAFRVPTRVYYFISYLNQAVVTNADTILGIGLDMFLGRDFQPYASVGIPNYATIRFTPENIPVWACRAVYENRFPFIPEEKNLLQLMIAQGKEIYFLKKCLPDLPENLLMGFTPEQMNWVNKNEAMVYNFLIQNQLLYQTRLEDIMRYVTDGPNTPGLPSDAPGNLASYIGWKIVTNYANNQKLDMEQVLKEQDAQKILSLAKYKP